MLIAGSYREQFGSRSIDYANCRAAVHPMGFSHRDFLGEGGARLFMVELERHWVESLTRHWPQLDLSPAVLEGEAALMIRRLHVRYVRDADLSQLHAESELLELLAAAARMAAWRESRKPLWLERIRERLHTDFDHPLTVAALAEDTGVHPVHLARTFRQRFQCTLGEYVNRVRTEHASRALAETNEPIAHVALDGGFADQSHLTRIFRKQLDTTPAAYRNLTRRH
jgi:AraC family transcriptional regulator